MTTVEHERQPVEHERQPVQDERQLEEDEKQLVEDEKQSYFNEWNQEINGKKYGYISIHDIVAKKTTQYKALTAKEVSSKLKLEADSQTLLNDEEHEVLISSLKSGKRGYLVKKEDFLKNDEIKEEFLSIFEALQIEYDSENNKYYDLSQEEIIYALPLIPEKYLRKKETKKLSLAELVNKVNDMESELKALFEDVFK